MEWKDMSCFVGVMKGFRGKLRRSWVDLPKAALQDPMLASLLPSGGHSPVVKTSTEDFGVFHFCCQLLPAQHPVGDVIFSFLITKYITKN